MRDYINPLLMVIITALFALALSDVSVEDNAWLQPELWLMTVCATGCLVNGALSIARGLAHRSVLGGIVWCMVHLVLGSLAWAWLSQEPRTDREEWEKYRRLVAEKEISPYEADAEGDTLLSLAAGLGKENVVRRMLARHPHGAETMSALARAAWSAARNGHDKPLRLLLAAGVSADADVADAPLLIVAVNSGRQKAVAALVEAGADVNRADAEGNTPFIHAVINGDIAVARYLQEHGADIARRNAEGRTAADYSRSTKLDDLMR